VKHLCPITLVACFLLCSCASPKEKPTAPLQTVDAKWVKSVSHFFPEGVTWNDATPDQIADAVFAAVKNNPKAAPEIAAASCEEAISTGRWQRLKGTDGKMAVATETRANLFSWLFKKKHPKPKPTMAAMSSEALAEREFEQVGR
jgi:hypothetical protein